MKKPEYINQAILKVTMVAAVFLMVSCDNQNRNDSRDLNDSRETAGESNDAILFENNDQEKDAQFLVNAAEINLEEIQLGQLAQQKGGTADVKELGKMMEDAHTKSLNDLKALAERKMITIPTSSTQDAKEAYRELNEESGSDFDEAYADKMISKHKEAIETFEDAAEDIEDVDIKNWASSSLSGLRTHLDHSQKCQNNLTAYNSQSN